jgi:heme-degrading monooxygenase HmoA
MNAPSASSTASKTGQLIARVWHGATEAGRGDEYAAYLERTGVRDCRATPGNRGVYVLRRLQNDRAEFTFISLWESVDAIRRFAGDDYEKAHYYPEDRDFLLELEPFVEHYDVTASLP